MSIGTGGHDGTAVQKTAFDLGKAAARWPEILNPPTRKLPPAGAVGEVSSSLWNFKIRSLTGFLL